MMYPISQFLYIVKFWTGCDSSQHTVYTSLFLWLHFHLSFNPIIRWPIIVWPSPSWIHCPMLLPHDLCTLRSTGHSWLLLLRSLSHSAYRKVFYPGVYSAPLSASHFFSKYSSFPKWKLHVDSDLLLSFLHSHSPNNLTWPHRFWCFVMLMPPACLLLPFPWVQVTQYYLVFQCYLNLMYSCYPDSSPTLSSENSIYVYPFT